MNEQEIWNYLDQAYQIDIDASLCRTAVWEALQNDPVLFYDGIEWGVVGMVWFALSSKGLLAVHMGDISEAQFTGFLRQNFGRAVQHKTEKTEGLRANLMAYLHGKSQSLEIPIDWSYVSHFQGKVLRQALQIPRGEVLTYGELAKRIGKPKAARAVGRALGTNPMPIVIPCHRIVGAKGELTGYIGGLAAKAQLLQLEGYSSVA